MSTLHFQVSPPLITLASLNASVNIAELTQNEFNDTNDMSHNPQHLYHPMELTLWIILVGQCLRWLQMVSSIRLLLWTCVISTINPWNYGGLATIVFRVFWFLFLCLQMWQMQDHTCCRLWSRKKGNKNNLQTCRERKEVQAWGKGSSTVTVDKHLHLGNFVFCDMVCLYGIIMSFIKKLDRIGLFYILSILFLCLLVHLEKDFVGRLHTHIKTLISTVCQHCSGQYCLHFHQTVHYIYHLMSFG